MNPIIYPGIDIKELVGLKATSNMTKPLSEYESVVERLKAPKEHGLTDEQISELKNRKWNIETKRMDKALDIASTVFAISKEDILGNVHTLNIKFARFSFIDLSLCAKKDGHYKVALKHIAQYLSKTHPSVIGAKHRVDGWMEMRDPDFYEKHRLAWKLFIRT